MRLLGMLLIGGLLAGCGLIRSDSGATRDSLLVTINDNEVGVVFNVLSGELGEPLEPGTYVINPLMQEVSVYFTGQQDYTMRSNPATDPQPHGDAISTVSLDGEEIWIDVTLLYAIDPASIEAIHLNWGQNYAEDFVRPTIRSILRETVAAYTAEQLYGSYRATLEADAQQRIAESMEPQGLLLIDLLVRDMQFTAEYSRMIEATLFAEVIAGATGTAAARMTATPSP